MPTLRGAAAITAALLLVACGDEVEPPAPGNLILDAQGVVFASGTGAYHRFPFGSDRSAVEQAGMAVYGMAATRRSASAACDGGPMTFAHYGPIQLGFRDDRLAGWTLRKGAVAATPESIAPGITRMQLEQLVAIRMVPDTGVPGAFAYATPTGEISGVMAGDGADAQVAALFAGDSCSDPGR